MVENFNLHIIPASINKALSFVNVPLPISSVTTESSTDIDGNGSPATASTHVSSAEETSNLNENMGNQFFGYPFSHFCNFLHII